jgi:Domain of unknown function (DUF6249)
MFVTHGMSVVAIFWLAIVVIVFVSSFFRYRERTSRHRMIETLAEKGQPIPPDAFENGRDHYYRYGNSVGSGIFLMCIGVALAVFFWAMGGGGNLFDGDHMPNWLPVIGIFPFMIGLARLLGGLFDRPRSK